MAQEIANHETSGAASAGFVRLASICALLTVATTLAVHWLPELWSDVKTFEQRVQLRHNALYMARLWVVLVHCVLVVVSMAPVPLLLRGTSRLVAIFGLGSYVMFSFVEMLRTSFAIFTMNRAWRAGYEQTTDENLRAAFRTSLETFAGINDALFFLFIVAFIAGLFCYGFALLPGEGIDRRIAWLFLLWGLVSLPGVVGTITGQPALGAPFAWVGFYFVPLARLLVGLWLWSVSGRLAPNHHVT